MSIVNDEVNNRDLERGEAFSTAFDTSVLIAIAGSGALIEESQIS